VRPAPRWTLEAFKLVSVVVICFPGEREKQGSQLPGCLACLREWISRERREH
jgi:hypothetical protein